MESLGVGSAAPEGGVQGFTLGSGRSGSQLGHFPAAELGRSLWFLVCGKGVSTVATREDCCGCGWEGACEGHSWVPGSRPRLEKAAAHHQLPGCFPPGGRGMTFRPAD